MKKFAVAAVLTAMLAVMVMSCGGGGYKGTRWVGEYGVEEARNPMYRNPVPVMTFQMISFDDKENKVSVITGPDRYLKDSLLGRLEIKDREYEVKGKQIVVLLVDRDVFEKAEKIDKGNSETLKQEIYIGKDVLKIGKVEFKKMKKEDAEKLYQDTQKELEKKLEEWDIEEEKTRIHYY